MPITDFALRRALGVSLSVLALGFGVSACGGDDDGGEETPAPVTTTTEQTATITQDELISQGDEICAEANSALGAILASTADETTKSSQVSGIYDGIAQQLDELGTPTDGEPPTDVIAAAEDLADGSTDTTEFQTAATEYGFSDCAESPEAISVPTETGDGTEGSTVAPESTESYVPPETTVPEPAPAPPTTPAPETGGGVAPTPPPSSGGSSGGSPGGSSGGIGPG